MFVPLRILLVLDSALLLLLGLSFMTVPHIMLRIFGFSDLPSGVHYIIGIWGCVFVSTAFGYLVAATDPIRHKIWVQVGIVRGTLEFLLGVIYVVQGHASLQNAGFGIAVAATVAIAYTILYPRVPAIIPAEPA